MRQRAVDAGNSTTEQRRGEEMWSSRGVWVRWEFSGGENRNDQATHETAQPGITQHSYATSYDVQGWKATASDTLFAKV